MTSPHGYSGTPLPKKLGIKPGFRVRALGAPDYFEELLGPLPEGARFANSAADLILIFATSRAEMEARFSAAMRSSNTKAHVWIAWPKKASKVRTDLDETQVREFGLSMGWVYYKVCAIDGVWSGLLFAPKNRAGE